MPLINQPRQKFTYTYPTSLNLLSATFLSSVIAIYRAIAGTPNYSSFIPSSPFNMFTTLDNGVEYIIDTKIGSSFTIPDAPLNSNSSTSTTSQGITPISIADLRASGSYPASTMFMLTDSGREGLVIVDTLNTAPDNDGTFFRTSTGQVFKRIYFGGMHVTWFGIIPNDGSKRQANSAKLDALINSNSFGHIIFNGEGNIYSIGEAPENRTFADCAYCIGLIDFQGTIECEKGVVLLTQEQRVGMHIQRTTGQSNVRLINVSLQHNGDRDAGIDHGVIGYKNTSTQQIVTTAPSDLTGYTRVYTDDWGQYKWNGLNAWGVLHSTNLNVYGYPGHNVCVFGATTIHFNGPANTVTGTYHHNNGDLNFIIDAGPVRDSLIAQGLGAGWGFLRDGRFSGIGGTNGVDSISIGYETLAQNTEVEGQRGTAQIFKPGNSLFADSLVFDGINNAAHCGGCGIFTTGNEANQSTFYNFRVGDSGGWAVCDSSLLKNSFPELHVNGAGAHFNDFSQTPPYQPMTGFTNRGDANVGTALGGHQYREGATGNDYPSDGTTYGNSGIFTEGLPNGGFGLINSQIIGVRSIRFIAPDGGHVEAHPEQVPNSVNTYTLKYTSI